MRTAIGAPDPGDFEHNQPHNLFNDRRIGGKSKNRAVGESFYMSHMPNKKYGEYAPKPKKQEEQWRKK